MRKYIVDTTLRDGEQTPGVNFFPHEKIEIAALLNKAGVQEVEAGTPAMGDEERETIRAIAEAGHQFRTIAWSRAIKSDIDQCYASKAQAVSISFPVSDVQLQAIKRDRGWVLNQLPLLVSYARSLFPFVIVGFQDATRADTDFLLRVTDLAIRSGADRIRIADTVGIMSPIGVMNLFANLRQHAGTFDFEFHAHNDFGMATANAITALDCGAAGISGTVNGIGERAGNAAIEEVVMHCYHSGKHDLPVMINALQPLSETVSAFSQKPVQSSKPIVGSGVFNHESGIHVQSLLKNKLTYQPFDESLIRQNPPAIIYGKHSGKAAITHFFAINNIELHEIQLKNVYSVVSQMAAKTKGGLSGEHLWNAYYNTL